MNISKVEEKKQIKRENLLASAYTLFMKNGVNDTSINDIVEYASVAKGTFYLYFNDKYDILKQVVMEKSKLLIDEAIIHANNKKISNFKDKLLNVIDNIIDSLKDNIELVNLINKNLSLGLYNEFIEDDYVNIKEMFVKELKNYNKKIKNPEVTFYMIVELVGSTVYNSVINSYPLPIDKFKPLLFEKITAMIK